MALKEGTKLGQYTIRSPLGAGGMGEIWMAKDERLDRKVAIKVLPAEFTKDAERVRRLKKKSCPASVLYYTNILAIYG